jgi:8-oxo-dGTP pyrophosphatase MutT (NUDIX family)
MNAIEKIVQFKPETDQEKNDQKIIIEFIKNNPDDVLLRENKIAHLTSSAMLFNAMMDKVLMVYHNIYQSWSWTGGHADGNSDLFEVAQKEASEETGIKTLDFISDDIISLDILPVFGHIKRGTYVSAHLHLSVAYVFIASEKEPIRNKPDENSAVSWIPINELRDFVSEAYLLSVYDKILKKVFK